MSGISFWSWMFLVLILGYLFYVWSRKEAQEILERRKRSLNDSAESFPEAEIPWEKSLEETDNEGSWVDLTAFPMDHHSLSPFGAQMVTKKTGRDKVNEFLAILNSNGIPYRTSLASTSMMQAEKVQVRKEDYERAKEILSRTHLRPELW